MIFYSKSKCWIIKKFWNNQLFLLFEEQHKITLFIICKTIKVECNLSLKANNRCPFLLHQTFVFLITHIRLNKKVNITRVDINTNKQLFHDFMTAAVQLNKSQETIKNARKQTRKHQLRLNKCHIFKKFRKVLWN